MSLIKTFTLKLIPRSALIVTSILMLSLCSQSFLDSAPPASEIGFALVSVLRVYLCSVGLILGAVGSTFFSQHYKTVEGYKNSLAVFPMPTFSICCIAVVSSFYLIDFLKPLIQQSWGSFPVTSSARVLWFEQRAAFSFLFLLVSTLFFHSFGLRKLEPPQPSTISAT